MSRACICAALLLLSVPAFSREYDLARPQPVYSDSLGYGYEEPRVQGEPFYFSVKVPDGNYRVSVTLGDGEKAGCTVVRAESRRLFLEAVSTAAGEYRSFVFTVNKRSPSFGEGGSVLLNEREKGSFDWDDRLTLEFAGPAPAVRSVTVEPASPDVVTVFLCGNSTVVDQRYEPWASWGQMAPRWFDEGVAISNHAESGERTTSFLARNRLEKVLSMMKPGDFVICEFGHNDQKEHGPGDGAYYNFAHNLKIFIDKVRAAEGTIVFATPTQRRRFDAGLTRIEESHEDYPDAMRFVAAKENVPVIELHEATRTFFETLGFEGSRKALVHYPAGTFPGQEKELADNTHFNPYGAYEVARMAIQGALDLGLSFTSHLLPDWKAFDPSLPDDPDTFVWYPSTAFEQTKPLGN